MTIRQLSVFLENKTGHLNEILNILAANNININALTVADSSDYGLLRMLVSDIEKALEVLRTENISVRIQEVISLEMDAKPGSMAKILNLFSSTGLSIEYVYAFSFGNKSVLVLRTNDREKAYEVILNNHLKSIRESDLKIAQQ
jgi:hypothetical protein